MYAVGRSPTKYAQARCTLLHSIPALYYIWYLSPEENGRERERERVRVEWFEEVKEGFFCHAVKHYSEAYLSLCMSAYSFCLHLHGLSVCVRAVCLRPIFDEIPMHMHPLHWVRQSSGSPESFGGFCTNAMSPWAAVCTNVHGTVHGIKRQTN